MNLYFKILKLEPYLDPLDIDVQDDGGNSPPYISAWRSPYIEPSQAKLDSVDDSPPDPASLGSLARIWFESQ